MIYVHICGIANSLLFLQNVSGLKYICVRYMLQNPESTSTNYVLIQSTRGIQFDLMVTKFRILFSTSNELY